MNRSSAQRLVHTLVKSHWLERDALSGVLSLGHRACYPAHVYLYSNELIDLVMPLVVELNARTGLSTDLWLLDGKTAVTLARVPHPPHPWHLPRLAAASHLPGPRPAGRCCLLWMPQHSIHFWQHGQATRVLLRERIASERSVGFSFDGTVEGGSRQVIATAFRDAAGQPLAAISLSGPVDTEAAGTVTGQLCETVSRMGS